MPQVLGPLSPVSWIQGDSFDYEFGAYGAPGYLGATFQTPDPPLIPHPDSAWTNTADWNSAAVWEQLINEIQARRDFVGIPRFNFSFGIGTGDATGTIVGLDDATVHTFPAGFCTRPWQANHTWDDWDPTVTIQAGINNPRFVERFLLADGYTGTDPATFHVRIPYYKAAMLPAAWQWRKDGGAWSSLIEEFEAPTTIGDGVTLYWAPGYRRYSQPGAGTIVPYEEALRPPMGVIAGFEPRERAAWEFYAFKTLRRHDFAIAMVLGHECMIAIEECARAIGRREVDVGNGPEDRFLRWSTSLGLKYEEIALVTDTDPSRPKDVTQRDVTPIPVVGDIEGFQDARRVDGLISSLTQVRTIVDNLKYVREDEVVFTAWTESVDLAAPGANFPGWSPNAAQDPDISGGGASADGIWTFWTSPGNAAYEGVSSGLSGSPPGVGGVMNRFAQLHYNLGGGNIDDGPNGIVDPTDRWFGVQGATLVRIGSSFSHNPLWNPLTFQANTMDPNIPSVLGLEGKLRWRCDVYAGASVGSFDSIDSTAGLPLLSSTGWVVPRGPGFGDGPAADYDWEVGDPLYVLCRVEIDVLDPDPDAWLAAREDHTGFPQSGFSFFFQANLILQPGNLAMPRLPWGHPRVGAIE